MAELELQLANWVYELQLWVDEWVLLIFPEPLRRPAWKVPTLTARQFLDCSHNFLEFRAVCRRVDWVSFRLGVDRDEIEYLQERVRIARIHIFSDEVANLNAETVETIQTSRHQFAPGQASSETSSAYHTAAGSSGQNSP